MQRSLCFLSMTWFQKIVIVTQMEQRGMSCQRNLFWKISFQCRVKTPWESLESKAWERLWVCVIQPTTQVEAQWFASVKKAGRKGRRGQGRGSFMEMKHRMWWASWEKPKAVETCAWGICLYLHLWSCKSLDGENVQRSFVFSTEEQQSWEKRGQSQQPFLSQGDKQGTIKEQGKTGHSWEEGATWLDGLPSGCRGRGRAVAPVTQSITPSPLGLPTLPTRPDSAWNGQHLPLCFLPPTFSSHPAVSPPPHLFRNGSLEGHQGPLLTQPATSSAPS